MNIEIICAGIGGRGVLLASTILIECAIKAGHHAMASDEYGMSQRGGSVVSHVKIGNIKSPVIGRENADVLLSFEESEFYRNLSFLKQGGLAIINSKSKTIPDSVRDLLNRRSCSSYLIDGDGIAKKMGMIQASNMAVLGFFSAFSIGPYNYKSLSDTLREKVPERLFQKNIEVFKAGFSEAEKVLKCKGL
ncbi:MAG TPA: 2-oxoacid:acceptor oxidoreductase family protein [Syntrophorhabdaceae bacterium]|nr:2-oxoacid:acceptor oxidoreductase family protein [Syntrophorhabdaceae bacterium]HOT41143.1 2-oxoacid:acceptor oxidoreductase family protein [Syntrophorhabdaceae bacterium]HPC65794.1 2-oxoacid:acceptor oxidoreductase family protein [Syntrophorhabdaceae bacterium]HQE80266.1 2-oxoacid:acceptor oxidoreductase family protein [Syntrophorhabdaceae bacterium]HQH42443.1 2-oxoacid:acceptor oxidoreductase family protein [Syntrophorhabdaceae bacterium]